MKVMGKRTNFSSIQASAVVPTAESGVSRVRTGYEQVVAHRTHMPFAYAAKQDGKIVSIDESTGMLKVEYKDGTTEAVNFGDEYTNSSSDSFHVDQRIVVNDFKVGDRVRKGDIVCYNKDFFTADPYSKQVNWNIGVSAKVALLDNGNTIEDASMVTAPLGEKLRFFPVATKTIVLTKDTNVHKIATIGTEVLSTDPLMIFDQSAIPEAMMNSEDPELIEMLGALNRATPKAEHGGTVVQIDVFYKCPISEMSKSIQAIVRTVTKLKNRRAQFAKDTKTSSKYLPSERLTQSDRVGTVDLDEETVVFKFYIKQNKGLRVGDKIFFDSSLKSVISRVATDLIDTDDPTIKVEACTSARGILARIISSPFLVGLTSGTLDKLEQDILDIWNE